MSGGVQQTGGEKDSGVLVKVSSLRIACCAIPSSDLLCRLTDERRGGGFWGAVVVLAGVVVGGWRRLATSV